MVKQQAGQGGTRYFYHHDSVGSPIIELDTWVFVVCCSMSSQLESRDVRREEKNLSEFKISLWHDCLWLVVFHMLDWSSNDTCRRWKVCNFSLHCSLGGLCKCMFNLHLYCFVFRSAYSNFAGASSCCRSPTFQYENGFNLNSRWIQTHNSKKIKREETLHGHIMDLHIKNSP